MMIRSKRKHPGWVTLHLLESAVIALLALAGCNILRMDSTEAPQQAINPEPFAHAAALFNQGNYEGALKENQRLLAEKKAAPDMALFNIGVISAYSSNPKKDYSRALNSFKTLTIQYPSSPLSEHAKIWIQLIEEHQRVADERRKLMDEKRTLTREREVLSHEREKQKYVAEKSRQLDLEIEKRRRQTLGK